MQGSDGKFSVFMKVLSDFYIKNRRGQYVVYAVTFLFITCYGAMNNLVFGRPEHTIVSECLLFAGVFLVGIPISYSIGIVRRRKDVDQPQPVQPIQVNVSVDVKELEEKVNSLQTSLSQILKHLGINEAKEETQNRYQDRNIIFKNVSLENKSLRLNPGMGSYSKALMARSFLDEDLTIRDHVYPRCGMITSFEKDPKTGAVRPVIQWLDELEEKVKFLRRQRKLVDAKRLTGKILSEDTHLAEMLSDTSFDQKLKEIEAKRGTIVFDLGLPSPPEK